MPEHLKDQYLRLKKIALTDLGGMEVGRLLSEMAISARQLLQRIERVQFTSGVENKRYFGYRAEEESRPINEALWISDDHDFDRSLENFQIGFREATPEAITRATYTMSYAVFTAHDAFDVGRKASATFFEILIGHLVSRTLGIAPRKKVKIPESGANLPTDFVFDPGQGKGKMHLPIKTSTRERAVQAWVHQLVLDGIFGHGVYKGVFVIASETKRAAKTGRITEICVPKQFQMFQTRVAQLTRIYYLDPPEAYLALAGAEFPQLQVKSFGESIQELPGLLHG